MKIHHTSQCSGEPGTRQKDILLRFCVKAMRVFIVPPPWVLCYPIYPETCSQALASALPLFIYSYSKVMELTPGLTGRRCWHSEVKIGCLSCHHNLLGLELATIIGMLALRKKNSCVRIPEKSVVMTEMACTGRVLTKVNQCAHFETPTGNDKA